MRVSKVAAFLTLVFAPALSAQIFYVGAYTNVPNSKGINAFRFSAKTGKLTPLGLMAETANPSFLAISPDGKFLYAVNESGAFQGKPGGAVSAFSIDHATGKLTFLNQVATNGASPAHVAIDPAGKVALVANYGGGSFASFPVLPDGRLGEAASVMQDTGKGPNEPQQGKAHAHEMVIADNLILGADLGNDHIQMFHLDAQKAILTAATPAFAPLPPGFGPRHMVLSGDKKFLYVLGELQSKVATMEYDTATGPGKVLATISALPPGFTGANAAAEIMLDKKGKTLYTSNRGNDSIAVFSVDGKTGTLKLEADVPAGGKGPRFFTLDPSGKFLLVANQTTNNITVFRVNPDTGALAATGDSVQTPAPVDIAFLK